MDEDLLIAKELDELRFKHESLDSTIQELMGQPFVDQLRLMRLKREKLQLKDAIFVLEERMYPDIIA